MSKETTGSYYPNISYEVGQVLEGTTLEIVGVGSSTTGFKLYVRCKNCHCSGQTILQKTLLTTKVGSIGCANSGCGRISTPETRRIAQFDASTARPSSPRERAEARDRQAAIDALTSEGGAQ